MAYIGVFKLLAYLLYRQPRKSSQLHWQESNPRPTINESNSRYRTIYTNYTTIILGIVNIGVGLPDVSRVVFRQVVANITAQPKFLYSVALNTGIEI
jgi:hypothetical protein